MKKLGLLLLYLSLSIPGFSQGPVKRTDSIVNLIESKKTLTVNLVSDTFPTLNSNLVNIESVKFYSLKNKLLKVIFSVYYYRKDSTKTNIPTDYDVFYFNDDILIKVISKDFDQSPPKDLQIYLNENHLKKYLSKETVNHSKFDGAKYFIELGYNLLDEFKRLTRK
jgi:uncharacterized protein YcfL